MMFWIGFIVGFVTFFIMLFFSIKKLGLVIASKNSLKKDSYRMDINELLKR